MPSIGEDAFGEDVLQEGAKGNSQTGCGAEQSKALGRDTNASALPNVDEYLTISQAHLHHDAATQHR